MPELEPQPEYLTRDEATSLIFETMLNFRGVVRTTSPFSKLSTVVQNLNQYLAGETIDASTTPQAVYKDSTDGKIYLADADDSSAGHRRFFGFVPTAQKVLAGQLVNVATEGVVTGFTSLTSGKYLYLDTTAGAVTQTAPTNTIRCAIAISDTEVLVLAGQLKLANGTVSKSCGTGDQTTTVTTGFRPRTVWAFSVIENGSSSSCTDDDWLSSGSWSDSNGQYAIAFKTTGSANSNLRTADVAYGENNTNNFNTTVVINNITETGFDIVINVNGNGTTEYGKATVVFVVIGE